MPSCTPSISSSLTVRTSARKAMLGRLLAKERPGIAYTDHLDGEADLMFEHACRLASLGDRFGSLCVKLEEVEGVEDRDGVDLLRMLDR
jgi:hypothetical protein